MFIPAKYKDCYLAYLLDEFKGQSTIIFVATCNNALRVTLLLRNLGFEAVCLHGQLSQAKRLGALNKFKAGQRNILVATDVASRGLDIPNVDMVLNFDIPSHGKDYIHRVGRTARAGKSGRSVSFVTQYDVEAYQRLETLIGQKLPEVSLCMHVYQHTYIVGVSAHSLHIVEAIIADIFSCSTVASTHSSLPTSPRY